MPLKKYFDEVAGLPNRIDEQGRTSVVKTSTEVLNTAAAGMDFSTTVNESKWTVTEIDLLFSAATARDFTISKKSVANIVFGRNDRFWMSVDGATTRRMTLTEGIYDGTTLAAEIKAQLDSVFSDLSVTFTVVLALGKLTITNSGSLNMTFYSVNTRTGTRRNSTAGDNMGFTADQGPATSLVSDTAIDLDSSYDIIVQSASTVLSYIMTDPLIMDSDSALNITTSTAGIVVTAKVTYEAN